MRCGRLRSRRRWRRCHRRHFYWGVGSWVKIIDSGGGDVGELVWLFFFLLFEFFIAIRIQSCSTVQSLCLVRVCCVCLAATSLCCSVDPFIEIELGCCAHAQRRRVVAIKTTLWYAFPRVVVVAFAFSPTSSPLHACIHTYTHICTYRNAHICTYTHAFRCMHLYFAACGSLESCLPHLWTSCFNFVFGPKQFSQVFYLLSTYNNTWHFTAQHTHTHIHMYVYICTYNTLLFVYSFWFPRPSLASLQFDDSSSEETALPPFQRIRQLLLLLLIILPLLLASSQ